MKDNIDIENLINIIRSNSDIDLRIKALSKLIKIKRLDKFDIFPPLMDIAINDKSIIIRKNILKFVIKNYFERSKSEIKLIFENTKLVYIICSILRAVKKKEELYYEELEQVLIQRYVDIYGLVRHEVEFFIDLEFQLSKKFSDLEIGSFNREGYSKYYHYNPLYPYNFSKFYGRVRVLSLANLKLKEIPKSIKNLSELKELRLGRNELVKLPKSVESLKNLRVLLMNNNNFKKIPKSILKLPKLRRISLEGNQIEKIPKFAVEFAKCNIAKKYLRIGITKSEAKFIALIEMFKGDTPLMEDHLYDDLHTVRQDEWYYKSNKLGHIIDLAIFYTDEPALIRAIFSFKYLLELYLYDCNLKKIPSLIGKMKCLRNLYLEKNNIKSIPRCIGELRYLRTLELSSNHIRTIPSTIGKLKYLKQLTLQKNLIEKIPKDITNIRHLKYLHLDDNQIKELPESIGNLRCLKEFSFYHNNITKLPSSVNKIKSLEIFGTDIFTSNR